MVPCPMMAFVAIPGSEPDEPPFMPATEQDASMTSDGAEEAGGSPAGSSMADLTHEARRRGSSMSMRLFLFIILLVFMVCRSLDFARDDTVAVARDDTAVIPSGILRCGRMT